MKSLPLNDLKGNEKSKQNSYDQDCNKYKIIILVDL